MRIASSYMCSTECRTRTELAVSCLRLHCVCVAAVLSVHTVRSLYTLPFDSVLYKEWGGAARAGFENVECMVIDAIVRSVSSLITKARHQ